VAALWYIDLLIRIYSGKIIQIVRCREIFFVSGKKADVEIKNGSTAEAQFWKNSLRVAGKFRFPKNRT